MLSHSNDTTSIIMNELSSECSNITKTLNDHRFPFQTWLYVIQLAESFVIQDFSDGKEDSQTCTFLPSSDTTLILSFSCHATLSIDIRMSLKPLICILHPSHFLFTSSKIWSWNINTCSDEIFFGQL